MRESLMPCALRERGQSLLPAREISTPDCTEMVERFSKSKSISLGINENWNNSMLGNETNVNYGRHDYSSMTCSGETGILDETEVEKKQLIDWKIGESRLALDLGDSWFYPE